MIYLGIGFVAMGVTAWGLLGILAAGKKADEIRENLLRERDYPVPTNAAVNMALWEIEKVSLGMVQDEQ